MTEKLFTPKEREEEIKRLLDKPEKYKNKRFYLEWGCIRDRETDLRKKDFLDVINELNDEKERLKRSLNSTARETRKGTKKIQKLSRENNELKKVLKTVINQLYHAQTSLIYEYNTNILEDERDLQGYFNEKYSKYGWKG